MMSFSTYPLPSALRAVKVCDQRALPDQLSSALRALNIPPSLRGRTLKPFVSHHRGTSLLFSMFSPIENASVLPWATF